MHVPTHLMSGWCVADCLGNRLNARQRLFAMIAAAICDVDGLGIVFGTESNAYWDYHHTLGHNLFFGLIAAGVLAWFSPARVLSFIGYLALFHLHLLMDYFGSGPGWPIHYLWPLKACTLRNPNAWEFFSWQNIVIAMGLLVWTIVIAVRSSRTPLELVMPSLDRKFVGWIKARTTPAERAA
jgi:hypothetical protein